MTSGDYSAAILLFQQAGNCMDAIERLQECYYKVGEENLYAGKFEKAYDAFIHAGSWGNTA